MSALEGARAQARKALAPPIDEVGTGVIISALHLRALLDATEPRPITDEMVKAAAAALPCTWRMPDDAHPTGKLCRHSGQCLDRARHALEAAMAKLREAETVIANVEDFVTRHYLDMRMGQAVLALTDAYKPTNQEGGNDGT